MTPCSSGPSTRRHGNCVHDTRMWRIFHHYVEKAMADLDFTRVQRIAIDEASSRRGHRYMTLFLDIETKTLLFATESKGKETVDDVRIAEQKQNPELKHTRYIWLKNESTLKSQQDDQRAARRHQWAGPGRKAQSPWLPQVENLIAMVYMTANKLRLPALGARRAH